MDYHHIVVGAGSAGAVVAARLSEDADRNVLLIEAGQDHADAAAMPAELLAPHEPVTQGHNWAIPARIREQPMLDRITEAHGVFGAGAGSRVALTKAALTTLIHGPAGFTHFDYPVGKVVGGSSAVNGALAMRGIPDDYDEWAQLGCPDWSWDQVLESFRALESDQDLRGPYSGNSGPVPVSRIRQADLHPMQRDFAEACRACGFPKGDPNLPDTTGLGLVPRNVRAGQRVSTAMAYLAAARGRPNLKILPGTQVDRVLVRACRAHGVEAVRDGQRVRFAARHVVLCAGALQTPAILMRSGIGAAQVLGRLDIRPEVDLPGVGRNLVDHPAVGLWAVPRTGHCALGEEIHQAMLRHTSASGRWPNDLQLYMLNSVRTAQFPELQAALGSPVAMAVSAMLAKPLSRGWVELAGRDVHVPPRVTLNLASEPDDMTRLMEGVRLAWRLLQSPQVAQHVARVFAWNARIVDDDRLLQQAIATFVRGSWHPVGTARMGAGSDALSVVDPHGALHGCQGLSVADASVMPTIPSAPTHLSCVMIGERMARWIRESVDV